jgi:hypothetical protein
MLDIFEDFWIFTKEGHPIVNFRKDHETGAVVFLKVSNIDVNIFKAFIQEMIVSRLSSKKRLITFQAQEKKFSCLFLFEDNIILICKSEVKVKDKVILKFCEMIARIFEDIYKVQDIQNWDGDSSFFDEFQKRIDAYFRMSNI